MGSFGCGLQQKKKTHHSCAKVSLYQDAVLSAISSVAICKVNTNPHSTFPVEENL